jgi:hypothetical protein
MTCKHYDAPTKAPYVNDGTTCSNKCSAAYSTGPPISIMQSVLSGTFGSIDSDELAVPNLVCGRNEFTCNLQNLIDETVANLNNPWQGSLPFKVHVMLDGDDITKVMENNDLELVDICEYLGGAKYPTKRLYFSPALYPPPTDQKLSGCGDCKSWMCLKKDLMRSAHEAGHTIVANGGGDRHSLLCSHSYRDFKSKAMQLTDDNKYRNTTLIGNDKENRRIDGKSKPRRRNISNREHRCPFRFDVKWDKHGFFVNLERRSGNQFHQFHPKFDSSVIPLSTRLLTEAQKEDVNHVMESACNKAAGRNYIFKKFGRFVDSLKMAYINCKSNGKLPLDDDIQSLLQNFQDSEEVAYTTLCDIPINEFTTGTTKKLHYNKLAASSLDDYVTISTTKDCESGTILNEDILDIPSLAPIHEIAQKSRKDRTISKSQYLFISIAWIFLPAFRFFKLCPEVIWCDVTSHSNNKGFSLLTFSCRTSINKQVVFMWVWIPNEQRISFRWVFQHAVPKLIPKWLRNRVRFIMKDGDPQQRNEIIQSLLSIFVNAIEGGCGWHIGKSFHPISHLINVERHT